MGGASGNALPLKFSINGHTFLAVLTKYVTAPHWAVRALEKNRCGWTPYLHKQLQTIREKSTVSLAKLNYQY